MAIKKLPMMAYFNDQPAFYDTDSVTAIEMTGKTYSKMQELVEAYNAFAESVNAEIETFEGKTAEEIETFTTGLRQEFQDFIDSVDVQNATHWKEITDHLMELAVNLEEQLPTLIAEEVAKAGGGKVIAEKGTDYYSGASVGSSITLDGNPADYIYFEIEGGLYYSSTYKFKLAGTYCADSYDGAGIYAHGVVYGSGGYWYLVVLHISTSGNITGGSYDIGRITSGFASATPFINKITGYKF